MIIVSVDSITSEIQMMRHVAKTAIYKCRLIKSVTKVGCCILASDNKLYSGCNFDYEWGNTVHAEDSAICCMVNSSEKAMIDRIYIYSEVESLTPCGSCRDKIKLFTEEPDKCRVYIDNGSNKIKIFSLDELITYYPKR